MSLTVTSDAERVLAVIGCDADSALDGCEEYVTLEATYANYDHRWDAIGDIEDALTEDARAKGWQLSETDGSDYCPWHAVDDGEAYHDWRHEGCVCQQDVVAGIETTPAPAHAPTTAREYAESILRALWGDR